MSFVYVLFWVRLLACLLACLLVIPLAPLPVLKGPGCEMRFRRGRWGGGVGLLPVVGF